MAVIVRFVCNVAQGSVVLEGICEAEVVEHMVDDRTLRSFVVLEEMSVEHRSTHVDQVVDKGTVVEVVAFPTVVGCTTADIALRFEDVRPPDNVSVCMVDA